MLAVAIIGLMASLVKTLNVSDTEFIHHAKYRHEKRSPSPPLSWEIREMTWSYQNLLQTMELDAPIQDLQCSPSAIADSLKAHHCIPLLLVSTKHA